MCLSGLRIENLEAVKREYSKFGIDFDQSATKRLDRWRVGAEGEGEWAQISGYESRESARGGQGGFGETERQKEKKILSFSLLSFSLFPFRRSGSLRATQRSCVRRTHRREMTTEKRRFCVFESHYFCFFAHLFFLHWQGEAEALRRRAESSECRLQRICRGRGPRLIAGLCGVREHERKHGWQGHVWACCA